MAELFPKREKITIVGLALLCLLSGCATGSFSSSRGVYHPAAFNDLNRAPAWMAPKESSDSKLDPVHIRSQADYHFTLGESYSLEGNSERALQEFKHVLVYDSQSHLVRLRLSREYVKMGLFTEALQQAQEAIALAPKDVQARLLLGGLYSSLRMFDKALQEYQEVLSLEPKNLEALLYMGAVYAEKKQFSKAMVFFRRLTKNKSYENIHKAYYYMSKVHSEWKGEKSKGVEKALKKALHHQSSYEPAVLALGQFYTKVKKNSLAKKIYKSFQECCGPRASVAYLLSQLYLDDKQYDLAYEQLAIVDAQGTVDLNVKLKMALILIDRKDHTAAAKKLEEILVQAPDSDKIIFYLAAVYEEMENYQGALKHYAKIPSASSFYTDAVSHTVYIYQLQKKTEQAVSFLQKALGQRGDVEQFHILYTSLLDDRKDYKTAITFVNNSLMKFPENIQLKFFQGFIYDKLGDKQKTITSMNKVLQVEKDHVQALNYLAYTYAEQGIELIKAEEMVLKAMSLKPDDGYIMDTYGLVLYKKGRWSEAVKVLEKAYKMVPKEGIVAEHLADAYYRLRLISRARKMYLKAMEIEKDEDKIQRIRRKLSSLSQPSDLQERRPASTAKEQ